ncbi:hypothetical protein PoB_000754500 [Plakobranchus ocellatus]|uniref:Uncharacterized protein n=1 Tax=Plakobranchus ocellatus TaxID=259542 RepID=A0AAV3YEU6_9GAST|nr:hypothetical protein PoB_000754500 [Plakobranchus ocellatus]
MQGLLKTRVKLKVKRRGLPTRVMWCDLRFSRSSIPSSAPSTSAVVRHFRSSESEGEKTRDLDLDVSLGESSESSKIMMVGWTTFLMLLTVGTQNPHSRLAVEE